MKNTCNQGNKPLFPILTVLILVLSAALSASADDGLMVSYSFSDNRTDLAENDAGGSDGAVLGTGLEWTPQGISGGGMRFSGAQAINTSLPDAEFTQLAFFVCANNTVSSGNLINYYLISGSQLRIYAYDDGSVLFEAPRDWQYYITSQSYSSGFHCFTLTCDGVKCFAYGDKDLEAVLNYTGTFYSLSGCLVGARNNWMGYIDEYVSSDIDEVRIYSRNLSASDVASLIDGLPASTTTTTEPTTTSTTEPATTTTEGTTSTTLPNVAEFGSISLLAALLLTLPGFAYLIAKKKK